MKIKDNEDLMESEDGYRAYLVDWFRLHGYEKRLAETLILLTKNQKERERILVNVVSKKEAVEGAALAYASLQFNISCLVKAGILERVARGVYRLTDRIMHHFEWKHLKRDGKKYILAVEYDGDKKKIVGSPVG